MDTVSYLKTDIFFCLLRWSGTPTISSQMLNHTDQITQAVLLLCNALAGTIIKSRTLQFLDGYSQLLKNRYFLLFAEVECHTYHQLPGALPHRSDYPSCSTPVQCVGRPLSNPEPCNSYMDTVSYLKTDIFFCLLRWSGTPIISSQMLYHTDQITQAVLFLCNELAGPLSNPEPCNSQMDTVSYLKTDIFFCLLRWSATPTISSQMLYHTDQITQAVLFLCNELAGPLSNPEPCNSYMDTVSYLKTDIFFCLLRWSATPTISCRMLYHTDQITQAVLLLCNALAGTIIKPRTLQFLKNI